MKPIVPTRLRISVRCRPSEVLAHQCGNYFVEHLVLDRALARVAGTTQIQSTKHNAPITITKLGVYIVLATWAVGGVSMRAVGITNLGGGCTPLRKALKWPNLLK